MKVGPNGFVAACDDPRVDVDPATPLPLVPTAPVWSAFGMMQPTSFTSCGSFDAVCDCAARDRRVLVVVERAVSGVLCVDVPDVVVPDEVRPV